MTDSPQMLVEMDVHEALLRLLTAARRWREQGDPDSAEYASARDRLADAVDAAEHITAPGWEDHLAAVRPLGEVCAGCAGGLTVSSTDNIPLCERHWSEWVVTYAANPWAPEPPCAAHLIGGAA